MLISSAPNVIPVNTANLSTEAVTVEALRRPQIPQPAAANENTATKNSTEFSDQAKEQLANNVVNKEQSRISEKEKSDQDTETEKEQNNESSSNEGQETSRSQSNQDLEAEDIKQIAQLQNRDREVRAHEQAHSSVGGNLAGAPSFNFTTGPDGKRYVTSGEVSIDVSAVPNDPAASIRKFELVQRAALAPANPSSQDRKVAAQASSSAVQSRSELNLERLKESQSEEGKAKVNNERSEALTSSDELSSGDSASPAQPSSTINRLSLSATDELVQNLNPVKARRQAAQLNQKIANSGALLSNDIGERVSISA